MGVCAGLDPSLTFGPKSEVNRALGPNVRCGATTAGRESARGAHACTATRECAVLMRAPREIVNGLN
jgi:hypothetical protein